jgi:hypothetical protein
MVSGPSQTPSPHLLLGVGGGDPACVLVAVPVWQAVKTNARLMKYGIAVRRIRLSRESKVSSGEYYIEIGGSRFSWRCGKLRDD